MNLSFHDKMSLMSGVILLFCLLGHVMAEFDVEPDISDVNSQTIVMDNNIESNPMPENSLGEMDLNDGFINKFTDE